MKKIVQLDLDDIFISEFKSAAKIGKLGLGYNSSSISNACNGKYNGGTHIHKNFKWYFADEYNAKKEELNIG